MNNWRWILAAAALAVLAACNGGGEQAAQEESESAAMEAGDGQSMPAEEAAPEQPAMDDGDSQEMAASGDGEGGALDERVSQALAGDHRADGHADRDQYRHPAETLAFFGLEPGMHVVELWPGGGGWYTEVLAPAVGPDGTLVAASFPDESEVDYYERNAAKYREKIDAHPDVYGNVEIVPFMPPEQTDLGEPGSADMVLTFRNLHNWHQRDQLGAVFMAAFDVLKPGGVFGVVEHRAPEGSTAEAMKESGYMPEDYVIALAGEMGFELADSSEVNANEADSGDHPAGVWTLPPSLRHCEQMDDGSAKATCREKYRQIGESDRMTLKFVKPAAE